MNPWKEKIVLLEAKGWSYPQIAARIGLSPGAIGDLKSGRSSEPRYEAGCKLVALYNSVVYGEEQPKFKLTP